MPSCKVCVCVCVSDIVTCCTNIVIRVCRQSLRQQEGKKEKKENSRIYVAYAEIACFIALAHRAQLQSYNLLHGYG